MDKDRLHILIERYFDGDTTLGEERGLRAALLALSPAERDQTTEEALAVMGYARMEAAPAGNAASADSPMRWRRMLLRGGAAAAVAAVLAVTAVLPRFAGDGGGECIAYVDGSRIVDEHAVMGIIDAQLGEMGEAADDVSRQMESDFSEIREAMDF